MTQNKKFRTIELILYVDSTTYEAMSVIDALENIATIHGLRYYYITHDKDIGEDGQRLKEHIHFIIYTGRDKELTLNKFWNLLGYSLSSTPIQSTIKNNVRESVKYLVHATIHSQDKYSYNYHDIITNDPDYVSRVFNEDEESINICSIVEYIDNRKDYIKIREIVQFVLDNQLWSYYRRNASIIKLLIDEHNFKLMKES